MLTIFIINFFYLPNFLIIRISKWGYQWMLSAYKVVHLGFIILVLWFISLHNRKLPNDCSISEKGTNFLGVYHSCPQPLFLKLTSEMCSDSEDSSVSDDGFSTEQICLCNVCFISITIFIINWYFIPIFHINNFSSWSCCIGRNTDVPTFVGISEEDCPRQWCCTVITFTVV